MNIQCIFVCIFSLIDQKLIYNLLKIYFTSFYYRFKITDNITRQALQVLKQAYIISQTRQQSIVSASHVALAMFQDKRSLATNLLEKCNGKYDKILQYLEQQVKKFPSVTPVPDNPSGDSSYNKLINDAEKMKQEHKDKFLGVQHLLLGLCQCMMFSDALQAANVPLYTYQQYLNDSLTPVQNENAEEVSNALTQYCTELVSQAEAGKLSPCIGRDNEIRRVIEVLSRRTKNCPVLTGLQGTGKTQIVEGLAQRVLKGDVPSNLMNVKIFALDLGSLLAGASYRGQFEERLKGVIDEVKKSEGTYILFIDEIHTLLGAGNQEGGADAANLLKPALARGEVRCIGATTTAEYRKYISKDRAFERRFAPIQVEEMTVEDTVTVLRGLRQIYENYHQVTINDSALIAAAKYGERYLRAMNRYLPDSAIDLLDESCSSVRVSLDTQPQELDMLQRQKTRLEMELGSLQKEVKEGNNSEELKQRMEKIETDLQQVENMIQPLEQQYQGERQLIDKLAVLKEKLRKTEEKLELYERRKQVQEAGELKYGVIPDLRDTINNLQQQLKQQQQSKTILKAIVTENEIASSVSKWTGIPVAKLTQSEKQKMLQLPDRLKNKVIGQDEAINSVCKAIWRNNAHLSRQQQPIGSFLFLGSSGVGKTELCKQLAIELFDSEKALIRIDMSEYTEEHTISRLIGSPPGYVGHEEGGYLTEAVSKQRYCVVLFDEIEKAHQKVLNVLLQICDDGRLQDGKGNLVDFTNTVIMLTSNIGSKDLIEGASQSQQIFEQAKLSALRQLKQRLPPELINRFDDIIVFNPLQETQMRLIFGKQIENLAQRVQQETGLKLHVTDNVCTLALDDCEPQYGARNLRRFVEREITSLISQMLLAGHDVQDRGLRSLIINQNGENYIVVDTY